MNDKMPAVLVPMNQRVLFISCPVLLVCFGELDHFVDFVDETRDFAGFLLFVYVGWG